MENFQLYRTNVLLGGQVKWDIVLSNDHNKLYVNDFNLTPISDNVPYTYKYNTNMLNYTHCNNLKSFYKQVEGNFYSEGLDDKFNNSWPIIINKDEIPEVHSNIYDMGCKRSTHYKRYNKQFEFFCPVWLEHVTNSLEFKITVNDVLEGLDENGNIVNDKSFICSHVIDVFEQNDYEFHNKFSTYLKNYIKYTGIETGNDSIINIKFRQPTSSYVSGINVKHGLKRTQSIHSIVANMITRERPVMEFDNMIINSLVNNDMICCQLFNFNLCFNIDDIMSSVAASFFKGKKLNVCVDVIVDGKELEKRDFYCNYDFIAKETCYDITKTMSNDELEEYKAIYPDAFEKINVLDHLQDNKCLDTINKNKYCPKICHWCLADNTSYLFNLYRGFDGYSITKEPYEFDQYGNPTKYKMVFIENERQYSNTPDITTSQYALSKNNVGWINYVELTYWNEFYKDFILNTEKTKLEKGILLKGQRYINGLKYRYVPYKYNTKDNYLLGIYTTEKLLAIISDSYGDNISWLVGRKLGIIVKDNLIMLITNNLDYLTFACVKKVLTDKLKHTEDNISIFNYDHEAYATELLKMMNSVVSPDLIPVLSTLYWDYADGPNSDIKEISYYKNTGVDYMFRYDGSIKPYFIDRHDILYYKDFISDDRTETSENPNGISNLQKSIYVKYAYTKYESNYPSIEYSACKKIESYDEDIMPKINVSEYTDAISLINKKEYKWFNNGVSIYILPKLNFTCTSRKLENGLYEQLEDIIKRLISEYYDIEGETLSHVFNLYEIKSDWEYSSLENIDDYIYNIELTLK